MAGSIGGIVLCGGESLRMGRAKAWLPFGPEVLLERVVRLVSSVADPVVVVAALDQELPDLPDPAVVVRDSRGRRGPLQGLADGLSALGSGVELAYATAVDCPFLEPGWVGLLADRIDGYDLALPTSEGVRHPLAALYRVTPALAASRKLLRANQLRLGMLEEQLLTIVVESGELEKVDPGMLTVRNMNRPEDYKRALEIAGFSGRTRPRPIP